MNRRLEVLLLVVLLLIGGCDEPEKQVLEKRLPYVLPDGSYGSVFLEHKPNTMMLENQQKINLTYYTVKHYPERKLLGNPFYEGMTLPQMLERGVIDIQFYDKNGNALVAPLNAG